MSEKLTYPMVKMLMHMEKHELPGTSVIDYGVDVERWSEHNTIQALVKRGLVHENPIGVQRNHQFFLTAEGRKVLTEMKCRPTVITMETEEPETEDGMIFLVEKPRVGRKSVLVIAKDGWTIPRTLGAFSWEMIRSKYLGSTIQSLEYHDEKTRMDALELNEDEQDVAVGALKDNRMSDRAHAVVEIFDAVARYRKEQKQ